MIKRIGGMLWQCTECKGNYLPSEALNHECKEGSLQSTDCNHLTECNSGGTTTEHHERGQGLKHDEPIYCACGKEMNELEQEWGICQDCK